MNTVDVLLIGQLARDADGNPSRRDTWSSSTLVRTDDGHVIVVDTSRDFMAGAIRSAFKQVGGVFPKDVDTVVLTHSHDDHTGCNRLFPNARILIHSGAEREVPDAEIVDKDTDIAKGVRLVHTPGHTPDSMSVFVESDRRYAVVGDASPLRGNLEKRIVPRINCDPEAAMDSMARIAGWADVVVPGHDRPFRVGAIKRLYSPRP